MTGRGTVADGSAAGAAGVVPPAWMEHALAASSDLVVVIDAATTITWCNGSSLPMLGLRPDDVLGHSFAEFLHPDDLERAAEVMALRAAGAFDRSRITAAIYRTASADGTWVELEVNASAGPDGSMLLIARVGGDLVLNDRLLEAVSGNVAFEDQVRLVLELGRWRHPGDGYVVLYREADGTRRSQTTGVPGVLEGITAPVGPTPWGAAVRSGGEVVVDDLTALDGDSRVVSPALAAAAIEAGFLGCLASPIVDPGHPEGAVIVIWTSAEGPTTSGHRYAMSTMGRALTLVLQQRAQVHGLEQATRIDHLTGATSRAWFLELLDQVHQDAHPSARHALLYVDLDGFKAVNDRHGHAAGDHVLRAAAERILAVTPSAALVARLGGDEFAVLCPSGSTGAQAAALAQQVVDALAEPFDLRGEVGGTAVVGASVGVALGEAGDHPGVALDAADSALLRAKGAGRGRWSGVGGPAVGA